MKVFLFIFLFFSLGCIHAQGLVEPIEDYRDEEDPPWTDTMPNLLPNQGSNSFQI